MTDKVFQIPAAEHGWPTIAKRAVILLLEKSETGMMLELERLHAEAGNIPGIFKDPLAPNGKGIAITDEYLAKQVYRLIGRDTRTEDGEQMGASRGGFGDKGFANVLKYYFSLIGGDMANWKIARETGIFKPIHSNPDAYWESIETTVSAIISDYSAAIDRDGAEVIDINPVSGEETRYREIQIPMSEFGSRISTSVIGNFMVGEPIHEDHVDVLYGLLKRAFRKDAMRFMTGLPANTPEQMLNSNLNQEMFTEANRILQLARDRHANGQPLGPMLGFIIRNEEELQAQLREVYESHGYSWEQFLLSFIFTLSIASSLTIKTTAQWILTHMSQNPAEFAPIYGQEDIFIEEMSERALYEVLLHTPPLNVSLPIVTHVPEGESLTITAEDGRQISLPSGHLITIYTQAIHQKRLAEAGRDSFSLGLKPGDQDYAQVETDAWGHFTRKCAGKQQAETALHRTFADLIRHGIYPKIVSGFTVNNMGTNTPNGMVSLRKRIDRPEVTTEA